MTLSSIDQGYDSSVRLHQNLTLQELIKRLYRLIVIADGEQIRQLPDNGGGCKRIDHKRATRLIFVNAGGQEFMIVHDTDDMPEICGHVQHGDINRFKM
jgi:hypothetical protein